ncbi:hypothetical protein LTR82_018246, partial [Friedmanniomyces endolithicus]
TTARDNHRTSNWCSLSKWRTSSGNSLLKTWSISASHSKVAGRTELHPNSAGILTGTRSMPRELLHGCGARSLAKHNYTRFSTPCKATLCKATPCKATLCKATLCKATPCKATPCKALPFRYSTDHLTQCRLIFYMGLGRYSTCCRWR